MKNMLITEPEKLRDFYADQRIWQGIPSVEVTSKGRVFITFYSGGVKEEIGNYTMIIESRDGAHFSEPIAVTYLENHRCYDPCLWIDPLGRLWFTWSICPDDALYGVICEDPDADVLQWSDIFKIGHDIMMNKPVVLSTGEWLFPLAVWNHGIRALPPQFDSKTPDKGSFVYKSSDNGKTFVRFGCADVENRHFDEHMVIELEDQRLMMLVRTFYGIGVSYSYDRGKTWSKGEDSGLGGPSSRFHICRLKSGRILLINHVNFKWRNNLTALISEDDGKTWCGQLLLDERSGVSYPDVKEADDGYIYIVYDRERGAYKKRLNEALECAREILMAKITEEDILQGSLVSEGSELKRIVSKLGDYSGKDKNPFKEEMLYTDMELAQILLKQCQCDDIIHHIFDIYPLKCCEQDNTALALVDSKITAFSQTGYKNITLLTDIIALLRMNAGDREPQHPMVERIKVLMTKHMSDDFSLEDAAQTLGMSKYYMCHLFKKYTGITVVEYRNELRFTKAKGELIKTNRKIQDIASECGFQSASYFSEMFLAAEGMSPSAYRKLHKN